MNINKTKRIGLRIKQIRNEKGLTQAAFAEKIQRDRTLISKVEAGECELSPSVQLAICNVFGVRREWLLEGKGEMYDDRWALLAARAKELDLDIDLSMLKGYKEAYRELALKQGVPCSYDLTDREKEYVNKLITIFRQKDEATISAITQNIDTFLRVPSKEEEEPRRSKKRA